LRVIADLHLHSKHSIATSKDTDLEHLAEGARLKGLTLLSTGDFAHPKWFAELKSKLEPGPGKGLYSYHGMSWILGDEVSTVYRQDGRTRKVHHLLFAPDFETVAQINEVLSKFANLSSDGRPVLTGIDSAELVERVSEVSRKNVVIPAHAWTPWFGVFGSKSGFDSLRECYKDQANKIFAIETGLSSDPPMNWRLSALDGLALISNSDAHSPNPWRLGREANAFDLRRLTYPELFGAIREKDPKRFLYTVEVDPAYGKYHFSGHSRCSVSLGPRESLKVGNRCPKCGKPLTIGVLQRVEELSDRPEGYVPPGAIPYRRLLPLYEIISFATGVRRLYAKKVVQQQDALIRAFGSEFAVLLEAPADRLADAAGREVADAIIESREGRVDVTPGFDGVYGVPRFS
jgi:uncharacterized protein (TIGR00375 family)